MKKKIFILFVLSVVILSSVGVFFLLWHSITINLFDKNQHLIEVRKQKILGNDFEITLSKDPIGYSFLYFEDDNTSRTFKGSFKNNSTIKAYFDYQRLEMPIISLYTEEDEEILSNEDYTKTSVNVLNCPEENVLNNVKAGIRLRGNSTKGAPKHPYRLKFDKKENLLGLNSGNKYKSWVLLAEYFDFSLSRNALNFYLGNNLNIYASDYTFVELYLNSSYQGVYLLCEQQEINKGRIDIEEYEKDKTDFLDTGYLLENDYYYYQTSGELYISCLENGVEYNYTHYFVKGDTTEDEQVSYITNFMQEVYDAIFQKNEANIKNLINVETAIEMTILGLISHSSDCNSSFYVYKDKSDKLTFGAPWDADMDYGNLTNFKNVERNQLNHLLQGLMESNWYMLLVKQRYQELLEEGLFDNLLNLVEEIKVNYSQEFARNYLKWKTLGKKTFSPYQVDEVVSFKSQANAADYLSNWLTDKITWLNNVWLFE